MSAKTKLPVELFIDRDSSRYCLGAPWTLPDGRLAATNTRAAIVFERSEWDGPIDLPGKPPGILDVLRPIEGINQWFEWQHPEECTDCKGRTLASYQCKECKGLGVMRCDLGHDHDCDECHGNPGKSVDCRKCSKQVMRVGNRWLNEIWIRRALMLPNCQWGVADEDPENLVFFRFDGGIGAIAPGRKGGA